MLSQPPGRGARRRRGIEGGGGILSESCSIHVNALPERVHGIVSDRFAPGGLPRLGITFESDPHRRVTIAGGDGKWISRHDFIIRPAGLGSVLEYTMSFPNMPESREFGAWLGMRFGGKKRMQKQLQEFKTLAERA